MSYQNVNPEISPNSKNFVFNIISSVTGQNNVIPIPVEFVRFTGDYNTAALLTQIIYWSDKTSDPEGWFYKSYEDWGKELALNKYHIRKSANILKKKGIIETKVKKVHGDPTLHYKLDKDAFINAFTEHISPKQPETLEPSVSSKFKQRKVQNLNKGNCKVCTNLYNNTEPTTELTTTTEQKSSSSSSFENSKQENQETAQQDRDIDFDDKATEVAKLVQCRVTKRLKGIIKKAIVEYGFDETISIVKYSNSKQSSVKNYSSYLEINLKNGYGDTYQDVKQPEEQEKNHHTMTEAQLYGTLIDILKLSGVNKFNEYADKYNVSDADRRMLRQKAGV